MAKKKKGKKFTKGGWRANKAYWNSPKRNFSTSSPRFGKTGQGGVAKVIG